MSAECDTCGGDVAPRYYKRESERSIYTEKKIGDQILSLWETRPLPEDALVTRITLIPYRGERPVLGWRAGRLWLPEGNVQPDESVEAAIARIGAEQAGILDPTATHLGHFRNRATSLSTTQPPDSITYQALYAVSVGGLSDFPTDTAWERRIILQRDFNTLIRTSYVEMRREYTDSLDDWLLERLAAVRPEWGSVSV